MFGKSLASSMAVVLASLFHSPAPANAQEVNLTIMVFAGVQNLPLMAAQARGSFAKRGLNVEMKIAPTSEELRNGLAEGRYQIVHGGVDNAVAMSEAGRDISIVIGGDAAGNRLFVQPDIKSIADLRGKVVIVDAPNTAYALQLYKMLALAGLKRDADYQVKVVGATFKRYEAMLQERSYSASMLNPPFSVRAEQDGLSDLGSAVKAIGPYQATAGWVMRSWGQQNRETLERYLQAYLEGLRWVLDPANKRSAVEMLSERFKLQPDHAVKSYEIYADSSEGFAKDAKLDLEGFKNTLKLRAEMLGSWDGRPPPPEKYIDMSFYDKALGGL
jgi:ABC-type nitrate/sulfonate/bicarbonate transport system substrate-binding protein